jgi:hypothetical protein
MSQLLLFLHLMVYCFMLHSEGVFFAVKEVPLHDQGSNAQQCIFQLEQVGLIGRLFY